MMSQDNKAKKGGGKTSTALDPRNPSLTQPFKRLVEEGFITELTAKFTPIGFTAVGKIDARVAAVKDSGLVTGQDYPLGTIAAVADKGNLIPLKGKSKKKDETKVSQPVPAKSLCKRDFELDDAALLARVGAVAQACGGSTLVGRVRSAGAFDGEVTVSFRDWWTKASPAQRAFSLVQTKQRSELNAQDISRLALLECPFQGPAEFTVAQHDDEEEEDATV